MGAEGQNRKCLEARLDLRKESVIIRQLETAPQLAKKGLIRVLKVQITDNEPLEKALKKLKKKIEREGILKVLKARKHYEKPSEKRRRKQRTSKKRKF